MVSTLLRRGDNLHGLGLMLELFLLLGLRVRLTAAHLARRTRIRLLDRLLLVLLVEMDVLRLGCARQPTVQGGSYQT
jgi:hypothetical protein